MSEIRKYIFVTGAPGSKWSSVARSIWHSPDVDRSDDKNEYAEGNVRHQGAYWDPGMEYGDFFNRMDEYSKEELEREFDRPFSGEGVRIIKSHHFANFLPFIRETWLECPIVMCYRGDDACLGWWVKAGGFDITYPDYSYYRNLKMMGIQIATQNQGIRNFIRSDLFRYSEDLDSHKLCSLLKLRFSGIEQSYSRDDIKVYLNGV